MLNDGLTFFIKTGAFWAYENLGEERGFTSLGLSGPMKQQ